MSQPHTDPRLDDLLYGERPEAGAPLSARHPGGASGRHPGRRVGGVVIGVIAACAVGAVVWSAVGGPFGTRTERVPLPGTVTAISVEADAASLDIGYADVPGTEVTVTDQRRGHDLDAQLREGRLVVTNKGSSGFALLGPDQAKVTIKLPKSMEGSAAVPVDLRTGAGSISLRGSFGDVRAESQAGQVRLAGSFAAVDAHSNAGRVEVAGRAERVTAETEAGRIEVSLPDSAPQSVTARSSAGGVDVDVPNGGYAITAETDAGRSSIENLVNDPNSPRRIEARSNAGSVRVH